MQASSQRPKARGVMVESGLKQWLACEETPSDFYQLLGQPRLSRNRDKLLDCLEEAAEYLFQFQHHKDEAVRGRALALSKQVAEARRTISDETRWKQYDRDVISCLHRRFQENADFRGPKLKLDNLRRWLEFVQQVAPDRIDGLVEDWTTGQAQKASSAQSAPETETQSQAPVTRTEVMPAASPDSSDDSAYSAGSSVSTDESDDSDRYRLAESSTTQPESRKPDLSTSPTAVPPPPPPASRPKKKSRPGEKEGKLPPPLPPAAPTAELVKGPETGRRTFPPASRQGGRNPLPGESPLGNPKALWIVLAAFLTALLLGMFGLMVAWASGAFTSMRSGEGKPPAPAYVQTSRPDPQDPSRLWGGNVRVHTVSKKTRA